MVLRLAGYLYCTCTCTRPFVFTEANTGNSHLIWSCPLTWQFWWMVARMARWPWQTPLPQQHCPFWAHLPGTKTSTRNIYKGQINSLLYAFLYVQTQSLLFFERKEFATCSTFAHAAPPRPNFGKKCNVLCSRTHKLQLSRSTLFQKSLQNFSNAASYSIFPSFFRLLTPPIIYRLRRVNNLWRQYAPEQSNIE